MRRRILHLHATDACCNRPCQCPGPVLKHQQEAALRLLRALPHLTCLKLSGAELLLPAAISSAAAGAAAGTGHAPAALGAGAGPSVPAAATVAMFGGGSSEGDDDVVPRRDQHPLALGPPLGAALGPASVLGLLQPQASQVHVQLGPDAGARDQLPLMAMASAPLPSAPADARAPGGRRGRSRREAREARGGRPGGRPGLAARREAAAAAAAQLRDDVCSVLTRVDDLRLRFNCCGTGVEKVLLALGPTVRGQLSALQWTYAKLGGPLCLKLLASCTNLRCGPGGQGEPGSRRVRVGGKGGRQVERVAARSAPQAAAALLQAGSPRSSFGALFCTELAQNLGGTPGAGP
jgi:hypothetical protein